MQPSRAILLVDDSASHRSILRVFLGGRGFRFLEAGNGRVGLESLKDNEVDLVIADVNMPKMDGLEFVRLVRASEEARISAVPIVILTVSREEEAEAAGADAWLGKPVDAEGILSVVDRLLGESRSG